MKFPRNARIVRGQLDAAPFAGVLFCLLIFVLLSSLVYTPGVRIQLPEAGSAVQAVDGPKIFVAMDAVGNYFYQNQIINESNLVKELKIEAKRQTEPLTLVIEQDTNVTAGQFLHLSNLAADSGIHIIVQQTAPPKFPTSANGRKKP